MRKNQGAINIIMLVIIMLLPVFFNSGCRTSNVSRVEKKIEKEKRRRAKDDTVLYQKALQRHMKNQTKETRKQMKRNQREADRHNERKREFFLIRWFKERMYQRQRKQKG